MDVREIPDADETLTTQMKSVGEAMSIGRTFKEALQKGVRSMEVKRFGLGLDSNDKWLKSIRGQSTSGADAVSSEDTGFPVEESKLSASWLCHPRAGSTTSATPSRWLDCRAGL